MKYRMLELGEKIQKDDQYMPTYGGGWCPVQSASVGVDLWEVNVGFYRRPIKESKPKYRFLKPSEKIRATDELYLPWTRGWGNPYVAIGTTLKYWRNFMASEFDNANKIRVRRKLTS